MHVTYFASAAISIPWQFRFGVQRHRRGDRYVLRHSHVVLIVAIACDESLEIHYNPELLSSQINRIWTSTIRTYSVRTRHNCWSAFEIISNRPQRETHETTSLLRARYRFQHLDISNPRSRSSSPLCNGQSALSPCSALQFVWLDLLDKRSNGASVVHLPFIPLIAVPSGHA